LTSRDTSYREGEVCIIGAVEVCSTHRSVDFNVTEANM